MDHHPFNPIPTGLGQVMLIYGLIPPMAGRNRVKTIFKKIFDDDLLLDTVAHKDIKESASPVKLSYRPQIL